MLVPGEGQKSVTEGSCTDQNNNGGLLLSKRM